MNLANFFNQQQFDQYVAYLKSTGLSDSSIQRKLSSIATFRKFLIKKGIITNPNSTLSQNLSPALSREGFRKGFDFKKLFSKSTINDLRSKPLTQYLLIASLLIIVSGIGVTLYRQAITKAKKNLAYTTSSTPVYANRFLSFQGRLTDSAGNPITSSTGIVFELYNTENVGTGTSLYSSAIGNSQVVTPDENGIFAVTIGKTHGLEIPNSVFTENPAVFLQITAGGEVMDPRQPIATVAYAINSETLQGLPPSASGLKNTVLVIDNDGNLNLGETSPTIKSTSGTLGIEGQAILLTASNGSGGDIEINPDASGIIKLTTEGTGSTAVGGFIDATNANLSAGNLYSGTIRNTNRGYNFLSFRNYNIGTTQLATRFSIDAYGNTYIGGTLSPTNISIGNTLLTSSAYELNLLDGLLPTNGSIIYGNGSRLANSSVGVSGQLLMSNGSGAPTWISASAVGSTNTYFAGNGLSLASNTFKLGGLLSQNTDIGFSGFNLTFSDGGTTFASFSAAGNTFYNPTSFTSAGDVSIAYDLNFTNSTVSTIRSNSPLYIQTESPYANLDINLTAANSGKIYLNSNSEITKNLNVGQSLTVIGNGSFAGNLSTTKNLTVGGTFVSVGSSNLVTNLNADLLDGLHSSSFVQVGSTGAYIYTASNGITQVGNDFRLNLGTTNVWLANQIFTGGIGVTGTTNLTNALNVGGTSYFASNVGIGNSSPKTKLQVSSANSSDNITLGTATGGLIITNVNGQYGIGTGVLSSGKAWIQNGRFDGSAIAYDLFLQPAGGNVGIGTTSPSKKLDVIGNGSFSTNLNVGGTLTLPQGATNGYILTSDASGNSYWAPNTGVGTTYAAGNGLSLAANTFSLNLGSTNTWTGPQTFGNLTIGGTFVSVGSTNTVTNLSADLLDGLDSTAFVGTGFTGNFITNLTNGSDISISGSGIGRTISDTSTLLSVTSRGASTNKMLTLLAGASFTGQGIWNSSGNVGIGTTSPTNKLEIMGDVKIGQKKSIFFTESFNNSTFPPTSPLTFTTGIGNSAFDRDTNTFLTSAGSARSSQVGTTIPNSGNSWLETTVNMPQNGLLTFSWKVSSENNYDFLYFCIDQTTCNRTTNYIQRISGAVDWNEVSVSLTSGSHTIRWGYGKDGSAVSGSDAGWIDDITFTSASNDTDSNLLVSGNIGIGTTNPTSKLSVIGNGSFSTNLNVGGTLTLPQGANNGYILTSDASGNATWTAANSTGVGTTYAAGNGLSLAANTFSLNLGSTNVWTAPQTFTNGIGVSNTANLSGNLNVGGIAYFASKIGIGTTNPSDKLHVENTVTSSNNIANFLAPNITTGNYTEFRLGAATSTNNSLEFRFYNAGGNGSISNFGAFGLFGQQPILSFVGSGNVGIGTTNPAQKLTINGGNILFSDGWGMLWDPSANTQLQASSSNGFTFQTGGTEKLRINASGNIGIGTTNPTSKLHVVGNGNITGNLTIGGTFVSVGSTNLVTNLNSDLLDGLDSTAFLQVGSTGSFIYTASDGITQVGNDFRLNLAYTPVWTGLHTFTNGIGISGTTNLTNALNVGGTSYFASNVGIGTTNSLAKLDVIGDGSFSANLSVGGTGYFAGNVGIGTTNPKGLLQIDSSISDALKLRIHTESSTNNSFAGLAFGIDTTNQYMKSAIVHERTGGNGIGDLEFWIDSNNDGNNVTTTDEKMRITSTGNVGIGTTSPTEKLHVVGNEYLSGNLTIGGTFVSVGSTNLVTNLNSDLLDGLHSSSFLQVGSTGTFIYTASNGITQVGNDFRLNLAYTPIWTGLHTFTNGIGVTGTTNLSGNLNVGGTAVFNSYVGIGTSNFYAPLSIAGTSGDPNTSGGIMRFDTNSASNNVGVKIGAVSGVGSSGYSYIQGIHTGIANDANLSFNPTGGNVGIGTTNPQQKLEVTGIGRFTGSGAFSIGNDSGQNRIQTSGTGPKFRFLTSSDTAADISTIGLSVGSNYFNNSAPSNGAIIEGNVGIGTTNPTSRLHVVGNEYLSGNLTIGGTFVSVGSTNLVTNLNSDLLDGLHSSSFLQVGSTGAFVYTASNGITQVGNDFRLNLGYSPTWTALHTFTNGIGVSGTTNLTNALNVGGTAYFASRVGIGTTNPEYSLQVTGTNYNGAISNGAFISTPPGSSSVRAFIGQDSSSGKVSLRNSSAVETIVLASNNNSYITNNNFGIGTTNPTQKLEVVGNLLLNSASAILYMGSYRAAELSNSNLVFGGTSTAAGFSNILYNTWSGSASVERMRIDGSGNVGIGTTNPGSKLEVNGGDFAIIDAQPQFFFQTTNDAAPAQITFKNTAGTSKGFINYDFANDFMNFRVASSERMRINSSGNVGIGTTNPGYKLDVQGGNINTSGFYQSALTSKPVLVMNGSTNYGHISSLNGTTWSLGYGGANNALGTSVLNWNDSGNVGIGTTNPTSKLSVIGDANISTNLTIGGTFVSVGSTNLVTNLNADLLDGLHSSSFLQVGSSGSFTYTGSAGITQVGNDFRLNLAYTPVWTGLHTFTNGIGVSGSQTLTSTGSNVIHYQNLASYNYASSPITGTLKITMPKSWSSTMGVTTIKGYNYSSDGDWDVTVSGYNFTGSPDPFWTNYSVSINGDAPFNQVRLAYDIGSSKNVILIGATNTTWSYPKAIVTDFIAGHNSVNGWGSGWTMEITTDESNITSSVTPNIKTYLTTSGNLGIGTASPTRKLQVNGDGYFGTSLGIGSSLVVGTNLNVGGTFVSVGSTNLVTNLNADLLDGYHASSFLGVGSTGNFISTLTNGVGISIAGSGIGRTIAVDYDATKLALTGNKLTLNLGSTNTWTGLQNLSAGATISNLSIGGTFVSVGSTNLVTNLNADLLDGLHSSSFLQVGSSGAFVYTASNGITQVGNDFRLNLGYSPTWTALHTFTNGIGVSGTTNLTNALNVGGTSYFASNVGIGTTNPDSTLSIKSNGQNAIVNIYGISSGIDYGVIQVSSQGGLTNPNNRALVLQPNNGNVGIGTTNPTQKLQISGGKILLDNNQGYYIKRTDGVGVNVANITSSDVVEMYGAHSTAASVLFQWKNSGDTPLMVLKGQGLVGIGTTNPTEKLTLQQGNLLINDYVATQQGIIFSDMGGGDSDFWMGRKDADGDSGTNNDLFIIGVGNSLNSNPSLTINYLGNVGIGTTNPTSKLHVVGNGNFTGNLTIGGTFVSVGSTNLVTNLNADLLDGYHASSFLGVGSTGNFISTLTNGVGISISGTGVGRTIAVDYDATKLGLTSNKLTLNLGSTNTWTALQTFTNGIGVSGTAKTNGYLLSDAATDNLLVNGDFEQGNYAWNGVDSINTGTSNTYAGNNAAQVDGPSNLESIDYIPIDPTQDVIQLEAYVKKLNVGTTAGIFYFGYYAYDSNKTAITTAPCGTYCYFAASGWTIPNDNTWHKVSATRTGEGTSNPAFPVGTRFIRVLGLVNYGGSTDSSTLIDHITLKRINTGPLFVGNNFSSANATDQYQVSKIYTTSSNQLTLVPPTSGTINLSAGTTISSLSIGGTFLSVGSTNLVTNLNADLLDGLHSSSFLQVGSTGSFISTLTNGVGISISGSGIGRTIAVDYDSSKLALIGNKLTLNLGSTNVWTALQTFGNGIGVTGTTNLTNALNVGGTSYFASNVGIGNTRPLETLDIYTGESGFSRGLKLSSNPSTAEDGVYMQFNTATSPQSNDGYGPYVGSRRVSGGGGHLVFGTGTDNTINERMRITDAGNVGIGTTAPKAKLDIGGNITTAAIGTPVAMISDNYDGISGVEMSNRNTGISADFRFTLSDSTGHYFSFAQPGINNNAALFGLNRKTTDYIFNIGGTLRDIAIGTVSNSNLIFGTNNAENMRISSSGNVGIGTTNPTSKLHVVGNGNFTGNLTIGGTFVSVGSTNLVTNLNADLLDGLHASNFLQVGNSGAFTYTSSAGITQVGNDFRLNLAYSPVWTGLHTFTNGIGVTGTTNLTNALNVGGTSYFASNVGIGTSSPSQKLDVNGNIKGQQLVLDNITGGSYNEGLRINGNPGTWRGIFLGGGTGTDSGTNANLWSILRDNNNNFRITTNSSNNAVLFSDISGNVGLGGISSVTNPVLSIKSTGNVGIGTTNPTSKLHVVGNGNFTGNLTIGGTFVSVGSTNLVTNLNADLLDGYHASSFLGVGSSGNFISTLTNGVGISISGTGIGRTIAVNYDTTKLSLTGNKLTLNLGSTNTWTGPQTFTTNTYFPSGIWNSSGFVGIGTTSPSSSLTLVGSNSIFSVGDTAGNTLFEITDTNITSNLPASFTSGGDVSMAYDLNFTNSTSSTIRANAPLYIQTESPYANLDINLTAANSGKIYLNSNSEITKNLNVGQSLTVVGNGSFAGNLSTTKNLTVGGTFVSVGSSNLVTNLNADLLDGLHSSSFVQVGSTGAYIYTASNGITQVGNDFRLNLTNANTWTGLQNFSAGATISNLSVGGTLTLSQGANNGYILTSDASGHSYWAPNTGIGTTYAAGNGLSLASNIFSLNLGSTNVWTALQTFTNGIGVSNTANLSDNLNVGGTAYFAGNVGIGTTDITGKFTVAGSSGSGRSVSIDNREIKFRGDGVAHMSILGPDTGNSFISFQNTSGNSATGTAGTDLFTILSSGNIGIGTTNPSQKLQITTSGANDVQYGIRLQNPNNSTTGASIGIAFANDTDNNLAKGGLVYTGRNGYGKGDFLFLQNTNNDLSVPTLSDTVMAITNGGSVGIGTTAPSKKLTVIGDGSFSTNLNVGGTLTLPQGASNGYILTSDANGNATWTAGNSSGVGTTYAAGVGLTLSSSKIFAVDYDSSKLSLTGNKLTLNLGSTNTWTALQTFTNGIGVTGAVNLTNNLSIGGTFVSVGSTNLVTNLNANYLNGIASSGFLQIGSTGSLPYVNNATNGTLTRSGSGPYTLGLNLGSTNVWTALQTFTNGIGVSGAVNLTNNLTVGGTFVSVGSTNLVTNLNANYLGGVASTGFVGIGQTGNFITTLNNGVGISISGSGVNRTVAVDYDSSKLSLTGNKLTLNLGGTNVWTAPQTFTNGIGVSGNSYFTNNLSIAGNIGIGNTASSTSGKLLTIGNYISANSVGEIYASSIIDSEDNTAFLDAANSSAAAASLSLYATGSIRYNTSSTNTHLVSGAASRIQNYSNGLLLGVSSSTTQGVGITGWESNLFLATSGNVGIGTTNPGAKLEVAGTTSLISNNSGSITVRAQTNGVSLASGATSWASASDIRLKNVISNIDNPLDRIMQLSPIIYSWKNDPQNIRQVGLIAQQVQNVLPEAVVVNDDGYLGIKYTEVIPLLTASIQELNTKFDGLSISTTGQINTNYDMSNENLIALGYDDIEREINSANYSLTDSLGKTITRISEFNQVIAAKIKAGLISTTNLIAKNAVISNLKSNLISTVDFVTDNAVISNLKSKKIISDEIVSPLADIDNLNTTNLSSQNANISNLTTQDIQTTNVIADKVTTNYMESNAAYIPELFTENNHSNEINAKKVTADNLVATEGDFDVLYADQIYSKNGSIGDILTNKINSLREDLDKKIAESDATQSALLVEAKNWYNDITNDSSVISGDLTLSDNLVIGSQLLVNGDTQLGNTFINGIFNAGQIAIQDNYIETTNSSLYIQPSQTGTVHIMGDVLTIADNGNVTINGNLSITGSFAAKNITADEVNTNKLTAVESTINDLSSTKLNIATDSASTIIASESDINIATNSAKVNSNATAGTATLPAGKTELIISTDKITPNSMVYLTPLASTQNQVLYVKNKVVNSTINDLPSNNYFTISLDNPLTTDLSLNWWIIN